MEIIDKQCVLGKDVDVRNINPVHFTRKSRGTSSKKARNEKYELPRPETIIFTGSARLPKDVSAQHGFGCVTIELEIDLTDETIVDISCTLIPSLGEKVLRNALLGNKVDDAIEETVMQLETRFFNVTRKAIIAALEEAYRWYKKYLKEVACQSVE